MAGDRTLGRFGTTVDAGPNIPRFLQNWITRKNLPKQMQRVRAWVDASWEFLRDPTYQAFREVMRGGSAQSGLDPEQVLGRVEATLRPLREGLFPELPTRTLKLMNAILFATLSGMAEQEHYAAVRTQMTGKQLSVLRDTLMRLAT